MYAVFSNVSEGYYWSFKIPEGVSSEDIGGQENEVVFENESELECNKFLEGVKTSTTFFAVYQTQEGEPYIREMNCNSGSYDDNRMHLKDKHIHNEDTYEDALKYIESYL